MECAICYEECGRTCKLICGHTFCTGCVKAWHTKGTGSGCPMCRRPMYFKGFHALQEEWRNERLDEIFGEAVDQCIQESLDIDRDLGEHWALSQVKNVLCVLEKNMMLLRDSDEDLETIEYFMLEEYTILTSEKIPFPPTHVQDFVSRYPWIS